MCQLCPGTAHTSDARGLVPVPSPVPSHSGRPRRTCENPARGRVLVVEVIGFEPTAPSLRTKCSAELSYTPRNVPLAARSIPTAGMGVRPATG
jgi:hypothetical protein